LDFCYYGKLAFNTQLDKVYMQKKDVYLRPKYKKLQLKKYV